MFIKKPNSAPAPEAERSGSIPLFRRPKQDAAAAPRSSGWAPPAGDIVDVEESRVIEEPGSGSPEPDAQDASSVFQQARSGSRFTKFLGKKAGAAGAAAPKQAGARKGIFSRFKVASTASAASSDGEPQAVPVAEQKAGGLFRGLKSSKKDKAADKAKPKAPPRKHAAKGSMDVMVELEGNKRVCWRVGASSFEEVDAATVVAAASFSRHEQRFATEAPINYTEAQSLALAEIGEDVRIVNASKTTRAVYASKAERIAELGQLSTGPGLHLVDLLLKGLRAPGEELICGLVLTGDERSRSLAVLYHYAANDEVAGSQITVNPDNLNFVLSQFAASRRLDADSTKFILFKNEDLLRVAGSLVPYPTEAMWNGISLRKVVWAGAAVAAVAAVGTGLYAGQAWYGLSSSKTALNAARSDKDAKLKAIDQLVSSSVVSFSRTQAIDYRQMTKRAGALWSPGSKVVVEAVPARELYWVTLPLTRGGQVGNNPSVLDLVTVGNVAPFLASQVPEGCTKDVPNISGAMNAVQITVTCENLSGPVSSYRVD